MIIFIDIKMIIAAQWLINLLTNDDNFSGKLSKQPMLWPFPSYVPFDQLLVRHNRVRCPYSYLDV
jgi:hypothetical protein